MHFVNPLFLYGLLALVIPVLIHLFNFRRFRRIYFSNLRFLQEMQRKTKRQSELKHLLILFSRMLAIAALVLAFTRPYFPVEGLETLQSPGNKVSIYLDNSFSMDAQSSEGLLLDVAKARALEIATGHKPSDRFQLLTNDFEGRHAAFVSREEFVEMLNEVAPSAVSRKLSDVSRRLSSTRNELEKGNNFVYMISDYQKNIADFEAFTTDTTALVWHLPLKAVSGSNVYIDSCWFEMPWFRLGQQLRLVARVFNASDEAVEKMPVKLMVNNIQRAVATIDVPARSHSDAILAYTATEAGVHHARVEITDFPVTYDDTFFLSYTVSTITNILVIHAQPFPTPIQSVFSNDSAFALTFVPEKSIDFSRIGSYSQVILEGLNEISSGLKTELLRYLRTGGHVFIIPGEKPETESYNALLSELDMPLMQGMDTITTRVSSIDLMHPFFRDVFESDMVRRMMRERIDLPVVRSIFRLAATTRSGAQTIVKTESDASFLLQSSSSGGTALFMPIALSPRFSNLTRHSLFVIIMYRAALLSDRLPQLYLVPGKYEELFISDGRLAGDQVFRIKNLEKTFEVIPSVRRAESGTLIGLQGQIQLAGNYNLSKGDSLVGGISVNYDRFESDLSAYNADEVKNELEKNGLSKHRLLDLRKNSIADSLQGHAHSGTIWKWLLLLALLFLATEIALIRLWK